VGARLNKNIKRKRDRKFGRRALGKGDGNYFSPLNNLAGRAGRKGNERLPGQKKSGNKRRIIRTIDPRAGKKRGIMGYVQVKTRIGGAIKTAEG